MAAIEAGFEVSQSDEIVAGIQHLLASDVGLVGGGHGGWRARALELFSMASERLHYKTLASSHPAHDMSAMVYPNLLSLLIKT
jgi:hypothetical protein